MQQNRLRMAVFGLWVAFWLASAGVVLCAPLRGDRQIVSGQTVGLVYAVSGVWFPAVSLLAAFWFPQESRTTAREQRVPRERAIAALLLTSVYLVFVLALIVYTIYIVDYTSTGPDARWALLGESVDERIGAVVRLALVLSSAALAPLKWLTDPGTN